MDVTYGDKPLDDDNLLDMTPNPNLGTITVQICRFERLRPSDGRVEWSSPLEDMQNGQVVHEKSKKMGGHCVS